MNRSDAPLLGLRLRHIHAFRSSDADVPFAGVEPVSCRCCYASSFQSPCPNSWEETMAKCDQCGNDYDKTFQVSKDGRSFTFDSFECAIQKLAPTCAHCGCRIIGHGVEDSGTFYCCAHCAEQKGVKGLEDRV